MYLEGTITLDPSQITKINKIKPTKAFKKFMFHLTLGAVSDKEERETFTAVAILQQINAAFMAKGIDNIIKLSHDEIDFYHDKEGKSNDLKLALDTYEIKVDESMSTHFKQLRLVLEHEDNTFKYLIETTINRDHDVGVYPIEIKVSGLLKDFRFGDVKEKVNSVLSNQEEFNKFKDEKSNLFQYFLDELKLELKKQIALDDIDSFVKTKYIIPKKKITQKKEIPKRSSGGGIYEDHHGFDDYIFYSFIWTDLMHEHGTVVEDAYFENDEGEFLGYSDEADTSSDIFDSETDTNFETENHFDPDPTIAPDTDDSSSSWFDFGDSDSGFFDSSCSSCSSCSNCGGCGGD